LPGLRCDPEKQFARANIQDSVGERVRGRLKGVEMEVSAERKKLPARKPISPNCADFFPPPNPEMKKSATLSAADF
jgi:hypothetical protein